MKECAVVAKNNRETAPPSRRSQLSIISVYSHRQQQIIPSTTQSERVTAMANNETTNTSGNSFIGGIFLPELADDAVTSLSYARNDGFEYCVTELPVPPGISPSSANGGTEVVRTDVTRLESKWWSTSVVGMVADPPHWDIVDGKFYCALSSQD